MDDQIQEVPADVQQQKTNLEERQLRAMCVDFATRIKEVNETSIIGISQSIYNFVTGA